MRRKRLTVPRKYESTPEARAFVAEVMRRVDEQMQRKP